MGTLPAFFYLFIALAALAVAGGLIVWVIRYAGGKGSGSPGEDTKPTTAVASAPAGEHELLRVSRTQKGNLAIFVQGRRYGHLQEIADPQVGHETIEALRTVLAFAEGWIPTPRETPRQPISGRPSMDEEAFLEQLRRSDLFSRRTPSRSSLPEPLIPVERINDLVQERLRERPDLAGRRICLTTGLNGSVRIYVGQQTFETVGDIPEPEVRALIQDAIHEWENSYAGPGRYAGGM